MELVDLLAGYSVMLIAIGAIYYFFKQIKLND
jgi:hypothetical protein